MYARTLLVGLMVCGMAANAGAQPRDASGNEWASGSNLAAGPDVVRPSYHQALLEAHRDTPVNRDLIDGPVQVPQVRGATSNPCSIVFGYLPYWESSANIQWNRLTHLGAFSIQINSAGNVTNAHGWPWTSLVNTAHANGVKVHLVVTLFDGAAIQTLINSPANKANFFENMRDLMIAGNADGINIDFESGSGWQGQMDEFMGELSAYMDAEIPGSETSIATAPVNWGNAWQFGNLVQNTDIIFIMGYAFAGSWSSTTGAGAPLTGGSINITDTVVDEYSAARAIAPEKIVLGCPHYGLHWTTTGSAARSSVISFIESPRYRVAQPESLTYGVQWDAVSQTPWYRYQVGSTWHQVWFDNVDSLRLKYELAQDYDLGGVGMWALNYDGTLPDLWNLIDEEFVAPCCETETPEHTVFADAFDDAQAAGRWSLFASSADHTADFDFDYATLGIPSAPNSTGGTTRGLKLTVNNNDAVAGTEAVSLYPEQPVLPVGNDYSLKFDMWLNYNGGAGGGNGSTEFMLAGLGHHGGKVNWPENPASDGNYFAVSGEGGSSADYRAYINAAMYQIINGVYAAPTLDHTDAYYQGIFTDPPFETLGAPGKQWVEVEIRREAGLIYWNLDGVNIVTGPALSTGDRVMLGYADLFASVADPSADNFVIYDNVRVTQLTAGDCNGNGVADTCEPIGGMDHDGDGDVDSADLAAFTDCLGGVNRLPVATQADCSGMCITAFDSDGDFDVDLDDFHAFQQVYSGS
jgi:spore germination protein YaaH